PYWPLLRAAIAANVVAPDGVAGVLMVLSVLSMARERGPGGRRVLGGTEPPAGAWSVVEVGPVSGPRSAPRWCRPRRRPAHRPCRAPSTGPSTATPARG